MVNQREGIMEKILGKSTDAALWGAI